jgi:hypothetical protein
MTPLPFGFRLQGAFTGERRLVDWAAAFAAYASCDPRAQVDHEAYLSNFTYGEDFRARADAYNVVNTAGFEGCCWAPFLWWDIDREGNLDLALTETRRLALKLDERFGFTSEDDLLAFLSGNKGFHVGLPTSLWAPEPSADFHRVARRFAVRLAEVAGVGVYDPKRGFRIDEGVYNKVQPFRAPNNRNPKSGLYKRRLRFKELMEMSADGILALAERPEPFDLAALSYRSAQAAADWREAAEAVARETAARVKRQRTPGEARLNRGTWEYLCRGAEVGDRHRLIYSAAANMAEFPDLQSLVRALLAERGLDDGLALGDALRAIENGLRRGNAAAGTGGTVEPPPVSELQPAPSSAPDLIRATLAALWARQATAPAHVPADTNAPAVGAPPSEFDPDFAELRAEREAIAAEGGRPDPPDPPPGARFFFADEGGRACPAAAAKYWTWEGAPRWVHVDDFPLP